MTLQWMKDTYGRSAFYADAPHIGRYYVRRTTPRSRSWDAVLNGKQLAEAENVDVAKALCANHYENRLVEDAFSRPIC